MAVFKVADGFSSHPAALKAGLEAIGLWVLAGSWCARHSLAGHIPKEMLAYLRADVAIADQLVSAGLWRRAKGGYHMLAQVPVHRGGKPQRVCDFERTEARKKIPDDVKRLVHERDEGRCVECGATDDITLDHIHPWSRGGPDTVENLRLLCRPCNSAKGARV